MRDSVPGAFVIPRVYPILDSSFLPSGLDERRKYLEGLGKSLTEAGIQLLEYRNKFGTDAEVLRDARILRLAMPAGQVRLVMDDRVDVALAAGFDGVHVDAGDLPPEDARHLLGQERIVGTSATTEERLKVALGFPVDYISFGPIYPTTTKQTSSVPIGLEGVQRYRQIAGDGVHMVAAAGITLENATAILAAGADTVAVAAAIFRHSNPALEFQRWREELR